MSIPLSVIVITKNEEKRIADCLRTVHGWADEIIIVDDNSTDHTHDVCRQFTDKIFTRKMELEGKQRNFGSSKARHDWVMMIDSDEKATEELKEEIANAIANDDNHKIAYWVPRKNYFGDYWLQHGGWYPAPHIKLYKKKHARWKELKQDVVHPGFEIDEGYTGGQLTEHLIHQNFKNVEDYIAKTNRHTTLEAIKWHVGGKKMGMGKAMWRTIDRFFRRFVGKGGHKDGYYGFVCAVLSGFYEWASYSKLREIRQNGEYLKEYGIED